MPTMLDLMKITEETARTSSMIRSCINRMTRLTIVLNKKKIIFMDILQWVGVHIIG